jgi:hypothetical protein
MHAPRLTNQRDNVSYSPVSEARRTIPLVGLLGWRAMAAHTHKGIDTETNGVHLVLFGMQNSTFVPVWQPLIGSSFHTCMQEKRQTNTHGVWSDRQTDRAQAQTTA